MLLDVDKRLPDLRVGDKSGSQQHSVAQQRNVPALHHDRKVATTAARVACGGEAELAGDDSSAT